MVPAQEQRLFNGICDRGLASARETREPEDAGLLRLLVLALPVGHAGRLPEHGDVVLRALRRGAPEDHAGASGRMAQAVHDDQRAGRPAGRIGVECGLFRQHDPAQPDFVEFQFVRGMFGEVIDVHAVVNLFHGATQVAVRDLEFVLLARQQRRIVHPDEMRIDDPPDARRAVRTHQQVAPADVDLVLERDRNRHRRGGLLQVSVESDDALDPAHAPRRHGEHRIADGKLTGRDRARIAAEARIRPVDVLHRQAQVRQMLVTADVDRIEQFE